MIGADGTVYFVLHSSVYALDRATGTEKWESDIAVPPFAKPWSAVGADGTVYVGADKVYAIDAVTGAKKWSAPQPGTVDAPPVIGADGTVYCANDSGEVTALDGKTGLQKWVFGTGARSTSDGISTACALGADGTLYVATNAGLLYLIRD
jgi:outer membrane protein assembly factor BamB